MIEVANRLTKPFRRLSWKLTFSYTAVTVGTLLAVELVVVLVSLFIFESFRKSDILPRQLIESANEQLIPSLRPLLQNDPPDLLAINQWLNTAIVVTLTQQAQGINPTIIIRGASQHPQMLVVTKEGNLLGIYPSDLSDSWNVGGRLDMDKLPGLQDPLRAALAGEDELNRLSNQIAPNTLIVAVPIWDEAEETVLGALVLVLEVPVTLTDVLGPVVQLVGISLLVFTVAAGLIGTLFGFLTARGLSRRLNELNQASNAWSQGDFSVFVHDPSQDELGQLAQRLNRMAEQLQNLLDTRRELAVVDERNRLARDLHDSAKQQAFAAAAQLDAVQALIKQDPQAASGHVTEAVRLVDELRRELTALIQELRPLALQGKGLVLALSDYAAGWSRQNGITPEIRVQGERLLSLEVEQTLFRIIQEALANVARHSQANRVEILLAYSTSVVTLTIDDDGQGFAADGKDRGLGLRSMQERAESMGGKLTIESMPGQGTRLTCAVPVDSSKEVDTEELHG